MKLIIALLIAVVSLFNAVDAFTSPSVTKFSVKSRISMEYIPDGLTKAQWEAMKKKEQEANKGKDLGAVGITKFKSRSFEAWQKSGQGHLYPVDGKSTPLEARPYMQRTGGSADGKDLLTKGIKPKEQALPSAKNKIDEKYEKLEKENKLRSYPFAVPWTSEAVAKIGKDKIDAAKAAKGAAKTTTSMSSTKKPPAAAPSAPEPKKKLFGLF